MGTIRFLLALSVIATHSSMIPGLRLPHGDIAVQAFFVVSGFYMTMILEQKYTGPSGYRLFLANRFLRVFPSYLVILAITLMLGLLVRSDAVNSQNLWLHGWSMLNLRSALALGLSNILLFGQDVVMFLAVRQDSGSLYFTPDFWKDTVPAFHYLLVPQAWSISMELVFYLVAPFLVLRRLPVVLAIITCSIALRLFLSRAFGLSDDPWTYRFLPSELATFLAGTLGYRVYRWLMVKNPVSNLYSALATGGMLLFIAEYGAVPIPHKRLLLFAVFAGTIPVMFAYTRDMAWDRYIGELSYPMYLAQWLILGVFNHYSVQPSGWLLALTTVAVAVLMLKYIDEPIAAFRHRKLQRHRARQPQPVVASATA